MPIKPEKCLSGVSGTIMSGEPPLEENMEHVCINIYYEWSAWTPWDVIAAFKKRQARGPIPVRPGVYEICRTDRGDPDERLYIGSSGKLRVRLYDDLMNDQGGKNATHKKQSLLDEVDGHTELLAIRWAVTEEYVALEHYLHRQYHTRFGKFPACGLR